MLYGLRVERTKCSNGWVLLFVGAGLLIALSAVFASASVRSYRSKIERAYRSQAELMAATYARAVGRWWVRGDTEMMAEAARLMVIGSALFVQVAVGDEVLVDQRDPELAAGLPVTHDGTESAVSLVGRTGEEPRYLDVTTPIHVSGFDAPVGRARIGFELTSTVRQTCARAWGTAGVFALSNVALIGVAAGLWTLRKKRRGVGRDDPGLGGGGVLVRGELRIDPVSKAVTIQGRLIELTPKQFALLCLLAEVPDRVLSDDDILAAVWPNSPYADSRDVKQCVYTLRRRLGQVAESPEGVIVNLKGYGYRLVPPDDEPDLDST